MCMGHTCITFSTKMTKASQLLTGCCHVLICTKTQITCATSRKLLYTSKHLATKNTTSQPYDNENAGNLIETSSSDDQKKTETLLSVGWSPFSAQIRLYQRQDIIISHNQELCFSVHYFLTSQERLPTVLFSVLPPDVNVYGANYTADISSIICNNHPKYLQKTCFLLTDKIICTITT